jgi:nitrogen-specific signal transduction histidine kinase
MFDPSYRYNTEILNRQASEILQSSHLPALLEDVPVVLLIINSARQVVYANRDLLEVTEKKSKPELIGKRPGECLDCVHAKEGNFGCGSTAYCKVCGLASSVTLSETGKTEKGECRIITEDGDSLILKVHTKPFTFGDEKFVFIAIEDISDLKARLLLESIFLHDLKNTSAILSGLYQVYEDLEVGETKRILKEVAIRIDEEIKAYRLITSAETQQLKIKATHFKLNELINEAVNSILLTKKFREKLIVYNECEQELTTDRTLLRQVIINMIKNALEAGPPQDEIELYHAYDPEKNTIIISVKNQQIMPENVKLQIFQKSFSTKGRGRGWGTYSIKLLTEKYLKGKASFTSENETGTAFTVELPQIIGNK